MTRSTAIIRMARLAIIASIPILAFVTLSPVDLRPVVANMWLERLGAFAIVGLLLGMAFPKQTGLVVAAVIGGAGLLEFVQHFVPDRHGYWLDFVVKAVSGFVGAAIAHCVMQWARRQD